MQGGNLSIPARIIEKSEEKLANFSKMPYLCRRIFTILLNRYGNNKKKIKSIWKQQKEKGHAKRFVQHSRNPYAERKNGLKRVTLFLSEFNNNGWQSRSNESLQPLNLKHYEQAQFEKHQPPSTLHSA